MSRLSFWAARLLVAIARQLVPARRGEWASAMEAELESIESPGEAVAWGLGCVRSAMMINLDETPMRYWLGLAAATAVLLFFEWHTDESGFMFAVLLLIAGASGFLAPRHAIWSALVIGAAIPLAHFASQMTGLIVPRYQHAAPTTADWIVMTALILVAGFAAQVGAMMRRHFV